MNDTAQQHIAIMATAARHAYGVLATSTHHQRHQALCAMAQALRHHAPAILTANAQDMAAARSAELSEAACDRLLLNEARLTAMAKSVEVVAGLPDPLGLVLEVREGAGNGLHIEKVSVPIGVIGMIYEARPNVTVDAAALCLKSGNAVLLRAGSESLNSARALVAAIRQGVEQAGLPADAVQLIDTADRAMVDAMLGAHGLIDMLIPRGGKALTEKVAREARVPTLLHLDGNCHTYLHEKADPTKAIEIVMNAKMRRTGICGATESLVIDRAVVETLLPPLVGRLLGKGCEVRGDALAVAADDRVVPATDDDWGTEYLDAVLSVKVVSGIEEAIAHINHYGSHHTDAIVTEEKAAAKRFAAEVDSAIVMINSSTQFADGGEFGMGAEIGIATGRLHARGPVGCRELTTYKYIVTSAGAVRA